MKTDRSQANRGQEGVLVCAALVLALVIALGSVSAPSSAGRLAGADSVLRATSIVSGPPPANNCFGGAPCTGPEGTTNGSGTTCAVSGFTETAGAFLYVVVNYLAGGDLITSVSDGGVDQFNYVAGEFSGGLSVAFYDVPIESGGTVSVTVTLSAVEFGTCRVGQLTPGTMVGAIGSGNSTVFGENLDLTVPAAHTPSLLLAIIGSSRPSGGFSMTAPAGNWLSGGQLPTGWNPGTESALYGYNDSSPGPVTFTFSCTSPVSISGVAVEFYLAVYPVTFLESGLASGTVWSVMLNGTLARSNSTSIAFAEPNGSFAFLVPAMPGYTANVTTGEVTVDGAAVSVEISFAPMTARPVTFQESGLPTGTTWAVEFNGTLASSSTSFILFAEPSGMYSFRVAAVAGYFANVTSGSVTVASSAVTVNIGFTSGTEIPVYFVESGLPSGTSWSVTVNATLASATSPTILFVEPKGTYGYSVGGVSGFVTNRSSGQLTVSGASKTVYVNFTTASTSGAGTLPGGLNDSEWFVIGLVVGAAVVAAGFLVFRSRGRRAAAPPPWKEGGPATNPPTQTR